MSAVDSTSVLVIVGIAAVAGLVVMFISPKLAIPVVVVELLLGILIGPEALDWAKIDPTTDFLGDLGLGMLFFFAGYEIDFDRIRGKPLSLGALGWVLSLVLAYGIGGILAATGVVLSYLYTGSALATTAIGTLIPILKDAGEIKTRFGTYLLAAGGMGEFGPILLITLILSTTNPLHEALILVAFVVIAVVTGLLAVQLGLEGLAAGGADAGDEQPGRRAARGRAGLRPGGAGGRAGPGHPAGRLRRRHDHAAWRCASARSACWSRS